MRNQNNFATASGTVVCEAFTPGKVVAGPAPRGALFRGRAKIGDALTKAGQGKSAEHDCHQATAGTESGLHFPTVAPAPGYRCYVFAAPGGVPDIHHGGPPKSAAGPFCVAAGFGIDNGAVLNTCSIEAHGTVGSTDLPAPFDGPYCGFSRGIDGSGTFSVDPPGPGIGGPEVLSLYNLTWHPTSAGSLLPLQGNWHNGAKDTKGELVALVQASGGTNGGVSLLSACLTPKGATSFDVNAITVLYGDVN